MTTYTITVDNFYHRAVSGAVYETDAPAESDTLKHVDEERYTSMQATLTQWYYYDADFHLGPKPIANNNATPMGGLDVAKWNANGILFSASYQWRSTMVEGADPLEVAGYPRYVLLAQKFAAGTLTEAETAALQDECTARGLGEDVAALIAKINFKDALYTKANGIINGLVKQSTVAIAAATDVAAVNAAVTKCKADWATAYTALTAPAQGV